MTKGYKRWDAAELFADEEEARLYVEEVAKDADPDQARLALAAYARYLGIQILAARSGLAPKELFAALNSIEADDLDSLKHALEAVGVRFSQKSAHPANAAE